MTGYLTWLLVCAIYAPVFYELYSGRTNWSLSGDYSHAYFILPISLWLTWRKRAQLKILIENEHAGVGKNLLGLPILVLGISMSVFGWRLDYDFISALSLVPLLYGLTWFLYGISISKALFFPIFYLLFLVPPPAAILDAITLPMRHGVSFATEAILRFFDYPVARDGLLLSIGYQEIFMGQPCSGFRSLVTMFSLVLVYVYTIKGGMAKKTILTSFIVPFALLGNLTRVIILCLITFYFGKAAGQGFFHNFSGIVIFAITILGVIGVEVLLDRLLKPAAE